VELHGTHLDDVEGACTAVLSEVVIAADAETLRRLARFLQRVADDIDKWGDDFDHDHYKLVTERELGVDCWGGEVTVIHPRNADRDDLGDGYLTTLPPLVRAARLGDGVAVTSLLAGEHDANEADAVGFSALQAACVAGSATIVRRLLSTGADVDAGAFGSTPLMTAAGHGNVELVEILLAAGADIHKLSGPPCVESALDEAVASGSAEIVKRLLELGAYVEGAADEVTPLMNAAELGHLETVRLLLAAGADPFQAYDGETALDSARARGHTEIAELLEDAMQSQNPDAAG